MSSSKPVSLISETMVIMKSGKVKHHNQTKHRASFDPTHPLKSEVRAQKIKYFIWHWIIMQIRRYDVSDLNMRRFSL